MTIKTTVATKALAILLEGMEETVQYEHVRNASVGIAMGYDFESFVRSSDPGRERFVSAYDDPANPENYLNVTCSEEDAETAAASVGEALSAEYEIIRETYTLDRAGSCIRIDASADKGGTHEVLLGMLSHILHRLVKGVRLVDLVQMPRKIKAVFFLQIGEPFL